MVEPLLYAALGFLTASLVALFMGRALWNRAVRLTTHRIMRRLPLSRDEIVASRDLLRAEVAVEFRKLERQTNILRTRMSQSMADVGRRDATIVSMRSAIEEANVKAAEAETRVQAAHKAINTHVSELADIKERLSRTENALAETKRESIRLDMERAELVRLADGRRLEAAAASGETAQLKHMIGNLERQIELSKSDMAEAQRQLERARTDRENVEHSLSLVKADKETAEQRLRDVQEQKEELSHQLELARDQLEAESRKSHAPKEEVILLRQQIERLASDIARVAGTPGTRAASSSAGMLQTAARASRDADTVSAAPVTFPPR